MDTVSLNRIGRLFWLGRYSERAYLCLTEARPLMDEAIDGDADYAAYCRTLGLADVYTDAKDFSRRYFTDRTAPGSVASSLDCAYDNAIVMREMLTSGALSYIQMAENAMDLARGGRTPGIALQWVTDDLLAFRGCVEETMASDSALDLLRLGWCVESLDNALRFRRTGTAMRRMVDRILRYARRTGVCCDQEKLMLLDSMITDAPVPEETVPVLMNACCGLFPTL